MSQVEALPFGLLHRDQTPMADRGYEEYPSIISYDPKTQVSVFNPRAGGPTTPTTRCLVEARIRRFMQRQGLIFSAMDFVLSRKGTYHFLENNPNGQWLWLEQITGVPLSKSMLRLLFG